MSKTLKILLIIGGVILFGFIVYYFISSSSDGSTLSKNTETSTPNSNTENTTAFLSTLLSLNKIKIDRSLFQDPVFSKLQDNTVPISNDDGVIGRQNPFASIDGQNSVDTSLSFPQINTGTSTAPANTVPAR